MVVEFSRAGLAFLACLKLFKKSLAQGLEHLEKTIIHHLKANKILYQMVSKLNQSKIHQESYSKIVISIESDFFSNLLFYGSYLLCDDFDSGTIR